MPARVLFICVHNSARSQIAEEFMNRLGEGEFRAQSAGLEPTEINPLVIEAMAEEGFDLSEKETNSVFEFYRRGEIFDVVVTVCQEATEEKCPVFPGVTHRLKLPFPDPEDFEGSREECLEKVRRLRDEIRESIREFIDWYKDGRNGPLSSRWEWPGRTED